MATKTAKKADPAFLEKPVSFGNVNIGRTTVRIGCTASRDELTIGQAEKHLCGKRLTGVIVARANGGHSDQEALPGLDAGDARMDGCFDVKGISITRSHVSFGLTFVLDNVDLDKLVRFAGRDGRVIVHGIEDIPEEGGGDNDDKDDE